MAQEAEAGSCLGWLREKSSLAYVVVAAGIQAAPWAHRCDHSDKQHTEEMVSWQRPVSTSVPKHQRAKKKPTIFQQII